MVGFAFWCALLTAAGLCYPRLPRVSGLLFIALGALSAVLRAASGPISGVPVLVAGSFWFVLGVGYLIKFRHPAVRAAHVAWWTAQTLGAWVNIYGPYEVQNLIEFWT
jgi:hypothetical protein